MNDLLKYKITKQDYINLINIMNGGTKIKDNSSYYLIHGTKFENIISIIETGYIKLGKDVGSDQRIHSGNFPEDFIYTNINFTDLKNIKYGMDCTIIINPIVMKKYGAIFDIGWGVVPNDIIIYKNDSEYDNKIIQIKNKIMNIKNYLDPILARQDDKMLHQIRINHKINVKYIYGIIIDKSNKNKIKYIKKIMKKKKIDIPIYYNTELNNFDNFLIYNES